MEPWNEYVLAENDRIVPVHTMGWAKCQPEGDSFDTALEKLLSATGLDDAGFLENEDWDNCILPDIAEFYSAYYLNPEEALFVLKGIMPSWACYRFEWENEVYFTMRPEFGLLCIIKNLGEEPINCYERRIRDELLNVAYQEIEAIYRAIRNGEILTDGRECESFDQWISFFSKRGFDLSHLPEQYTTGSLSKNLKFTPPVSKAEKKKLIHELPINTDDDVKWKDIKITFLSDEEILIQYGQEHTQRRFNHAGLQIAEAENQFQRGLR